MNLGWGAAMRPPPMGPPLGAGDDDALPTFRVMDPHHMPFFVPPRGTRLTVESQLIERNGDRSLLLSWDEPTQNQRYYQVLVVAIWERVD